MNACTFLASAIDDVALGMTPSSALATHLATCAACAAQLERRRALAQRIDRAVAAHARAEPSPGLARRIGVRASLRRPRRWNPVWLGVPAAAALAGGALVVIAAFGGQRAAVHASTIAALDAWRSPTASLLVSRSNVLDTPFTLPTHRRSST